MIDHFTLSVADFEASKKFYTAVLAALGYTPKMEFDGMVGYGDAKPYFWVKQAPIVTTPQHIAFQAGSRAMVDAFHQAAVAAGAKDDGAPGIRGDYHPNYYAAFVIDPFNGHPLEAVIHHAPAAAVKPAPAKKAAAKKVAPKKVAPKKVAAKPAKKVVAKKPVAKKPAKKSRR
jgi:catechol 2,3-dioxygenase-like lactoylglutathione lyase family enzyme